MLPIWLKSIDSACLIEFIVEWLSGISWYADYVCWTLIELLYGLPLGIRHLDFSLELGLGLFNNFLDYRLGFGLLENKIVYIMKLTYVVARTFNPTFMAKRANNAMEKPSNWEHHVNMMIDNKEYNRYGWCDGATTWISYWSQLQSCRAWNDIRNGTKFGQNGFQREKISVFR